MVNVSSPLLLVNPLKTTVLPGSNVIATFAPTSGVALLDGADGGVTVKLALLVSEVPEMNMLDIFILA